jgi:hypothetical protein
MAPKGATFYLQKKMVILQENLQENLSNKTILTKTNN